MEALRLAILLQELLIERMDAFEIRHTCDPFQRLPWDRLDPISRQLYVERAEQLLKRFDLVPKGGN
jgi:hypothetical protein